MGRGNAIILRASCVDEARLGWAALRRNSISFSIGTRLQRLRETMIGRQAAKNCRERLTAYNSRPCMAKNGVRHHRREVGVPRRLIAPRYGTLAGERRPFGGWSTVSLSPLGMANILRCTVCRQLGAFLQGPVLLYLLEPDAYLCLPHFFALKRCTIFAAWISSMADALAKAGE